MKVIKYKFLSSAEGDGLEPICINKTVRCADAVFDANYAIAEKEAYNGEITVEEVTTDAENT